MKELSNRQKELLNYLQNNINRFVSKKQICKDLPFAYPRHLENHNNEGNKSTAFKNISYDVRQLNDSGMQQIIICNHHGYKLANEQEAKEYIKRRFKRDFKSLKLDYKLANKVNKDHQLYFEDSDIKEFVTFVR